MSDFYIVGIGSSAGGIEALFDFFSNVKPSDNAAYVVIPHLKRDYPSVLSLLLQKRTLLQTKAIEHAEVVEPNKIYVLPQNKVVSIKNGALLLKPRPKEEIINKAIDTFFYSLAEERKERAVGIILSGLGSDGTEGAIHLKKHRGIVLVQDPNTAAYSNMPESTIHFDHPDQILSPTEMPSALEKYFKRIVHPAQNIKN